jgi:GDP-L-fucose synthase
LIHKIHKAKQERNPTVVLWGSGRPLREFLHVNDLADACVFIVKHYHGREPINIGAGREISIRDLADLIARVVGYEGKFVFDTTKPDGTPRKLVETSKMSALGWQAKISLEVGIRDLYQYWLDTRVNKRTSVIN